MVLSTMTALLIAVMAMYFSVVSSRSVQYAVFNQNQSYQSAISVQEALRSWLNANDKSDLVTQMKALEEGKTMTTNGNGFAALGVAGGSEDINQLGSYDVSITKVKPETIAGIECTTYDVATTVVVGGVRETVHIYWHIPPSESEDSKVNSDIFASTGYVPNNADVASGMFMTRSVFDNEFVNFGNGEGEYKLYGDVFCGGSVEMNKGNTVDLSDVLSFVVRDKFFVNNVSTFNLGKNGERGKMYIGKELNVTGGFNLNNVDIYVADGDVHWEGGMNANGGSTLNIQGNLYITGGSPDRGNLNRTVKLNGRIYVNGEDKTDYYGCAAWPKAERDAAAQYIDDNTQSYEFGNWEIENKFPTTPMKIEFNSAAGVYEKEISFSGGSDKTCYTSIGDIKDIDFSGDIRNYTIFIDTGDDEENIHYLRVNANYDADGDDVDETFCWNPLGLTPFGEGSGNVNQKNMNVLVTGRGSLIIDIPSGVTYAGSQYEKFMHYGWFLLLGGATNANGGYSLETRNRQNDVKQFLHASCPDGCSDCTYNVEQLTTKCSECGTYQKKVTCDRHNYHRTFCPNTECDLNVNEPNKNESGDYSELCANRIDRSKVRDAINTNDSLRSKYPKGVDGDYIYPNCNIFLVSCDESASIYIADYPVLNTSGDEVTCLPIESNSYFGFVYAPYMTYKGYHSGETNTVRFCGGMVVSDYIFNDNSWYLNCYPDYMPGELGATGSLAHDAKRWKIIIGRN